MAENSNQIAVKKRLIYAEDLFEPVDRKVHIIGGRSSGKTMAMYEQLFRERVEMAPTIDAVPVDEIIFHHILIDKDGIPEVKLQLGERTLTLRKTDPVDVVEVVRCKDCTKWKEPWLEAQTCGRCTAGKTAITEPMHFCAYGERRTDHES